MKNRSVAFLLVVIVAMFPFGCKDEPVNSTAPDFAKFAWIDFDSFRTSYDFGTYSFNVQTQLIRRLGYKQGQLLFAIDSSLNEYIETCSPILGDSTCHSFYIYSLVDAMWLSGNASTKIYHALGAERVVVADTIIASARFTGSTNIHVSDPSIRQLDSLVGKTLYASITVVKRKIPSPSGLNYSVDIFANIDRVWVK